MKVFVVTGMSESGDSIEPLVFLKEPSEKSILQLLKDLYPEEYREDLSLLYNLWEVEALELPV